MPNRLKDKVALVTGAGRGLGRAIAAALAAEGASVVLTARTQQQLSETAQSIQDNGVNVHVVPADLTREADITELIQSVERQFRRLDILANNAGVTLSAKLDETTIEDWDRVFSVNSRAPFLLCRQALPLLAKAETGYIINIGSIVSVKGYALQSAYTASKHALRGMTIALAEELRGTNIRAHMICPGGIDTSMVGNVRPDIKKEDLMQPEEIAELVLYLVTHNGNAVIDELHIRRAASSPWF